MVLARNVRRLAVSSLFTMVALGGAGCAASRHCGSADGECRSEQDCSASCETPCEQPCEIPCEKPCKTACEKQCKTCGPICCNPKADIEALHAVNVPCTTDLAIGYVVDTECSCDDFDLLVRVEHCGNTLFERLIHMGMPYRTDADGDRHFHGSIEGKLPEIICADRSKLIVIGWVVPHDANGDTSAALDREHERVHGKDDDFLKQAWVPTGWPPAKVHNLQH